MIQPNDGLRIGKRRNLQIIGNESIIIMYYVCVQALVDILPFHL